MIKAYANVKLKIVENANFDDRSGETVKYFKNYLKTEEGELLILGGKLDFSEFEGQGGVATLEIRQMYDGRGVKVTLVGFTEGEFEEPSNIIS